MPLYEGSTSRELQSVSRLWHVKGDRAVHNEDKTYFLYERGDAGYGTVDWFYVRSTESRQEADDWFDGKGDL